MSSEQAAPPQRQLTRAHFDRPCDRAGSERSGGADQCPTANWDQRGFEVERAR